MARVWCEECQRDIAPGSIGPCLRCEDRFHRYGPGRHSGICPSCRAKGLTYGEDNKRTTPLEWTEEEPWP